MIQQKSGSTCPSLEITGLHAHKTQHAKLSVVANQIRIDKGLYLARNPHQINTNWACSAKSEVDLVTDYLRGLKTYLALKRFSEKTYRPILDNLLANLLSAANTDSQLLYSRDTGANGSAKRQFVQVVDYLSQAGLVYSVIGRGNEYSGNASWLIPSGKLKRSFTDSRMRVQLAQGAPMVILRAENGDDKRLPLGKKTIRLQVERLSVPVREYNRLWLNHSATLHGNELVPFLRRIFNRSLDLGGRYYGASHLTLKKALRGLIQIDGEETVELDYKALHLCLLYAAKGVQLDPRLADPYTIQGYERDTVKTALLSLLNAGSVSGWCRNVTKSGNPATKKVIAEYREAYTRFVMRSAIGKPAEQPKKPIQAKGFIEGMPDGISGALLFTAISGRHNCISDLFGSLDIGVKLQFIDSQIMSYALLRLSEFGIPVLPVHDSIRCRISDQETVQKIMLDAYRSVVGFDGFLG